MDIGRIPDWMKDQASAVADCAAAATTIDAEIAATAAIVRGLNEYVLFTVCGLRERCVVPPSLHAITIAAPLPGPTADPAAA